MSGYADVDMQHGVPRGTGERPATDQDRRRELQKIDDYRGLVTSVALKVGRYRLPSICPNLVIDSRS